MCLRLTARLRSGRRGFIVLVAAVHRFELAAIERHDRF